MPISYDTLDNSTFLDFQGYRSDVGPITGGTEVDDFKVNVALVFERNSDAATLDQLLSMDWGPRQQEIAKMTADGTLWSTFGANEQTYENVVNFLKSPDVNIKIRDYDTTSSQYISSVESRTLWVELDKSSFNTLFNTKLMQGQTATGDTTWYWDGKLSLPTELSGPLGVAGLWFDSFEFHTALPNRTDVPAVPPEPGPGIGNGSPLTSDEKALYPSDIAADYYNFPLTDAYWLTVKTGTIGLLESDLGIRIKGDDFDTLLDNYRLGAGIDTASDAVGVDPGGDKDKESSERSLDVGVVTTINPQSKLVLYAGSGKKDDAKSEPFTTYQAAIWDTSHDPEVISSSERFAAAQMTPDSPFAFAVNQLLADAALAGITVFSSAGDGGSGYSTANGLTNVSGARASQYSVIVGGTSLSSMEIAETDPTLSKIRNDALAGDADTIWRLVANGLSVLPSSAPDSARFIETVWNTYKLDGTTFEQKGYYGNLAGNGGVDSTQPVPHYQTEFGLTPTTTDGQALTGRGVPDVSANAGGNLFYLVPTKEMDKTHGDGGTSGATPFWASLASQINAILLDQGTQMTLGYMTDLLYVAAAIAPGSFNDVLHGDNNSSFLENGTYHADGHDITPTGFGYEAGPGYDLASGLGSPNGVLLARALSAIAHSELFFHDGPDAAPHVLTWHEADGWQSGADQTLLLQAMSAGSLQIDVDAGASDISFSNAGSGTYAWTMRFAQQTLQSDFDPSLVTMFDGYKIGTVVQTHAADSASFYMTLNGSAATSPQGMLSSDFGFADFGGGGGAVRVAQPVAIAETAAGADDATAIVRVRQNGKDSLGLVFYQVDDLSGTVNGIAPGQAGYAAAAQANAYQLGSGGILLGGPGYGNFTQNSLLDVDAGDLVAMALVNMSKGDTYFAFSQANPDGQGHLWNFGLNTWGWEDTKGGGDQDFNDLVVQLDFTSAAGKGILVL